MKIQASNLVSAIGLAAGMLYAAPAAAQVSEEGASQSGTPQEIIVTAQRREENLQDVSIAATALSGDQLQGKAVDSLEDLEFAAPSLSITDQGLTQSVNIRGIGIASGSPAVANGVATYIDGVFQPPILTASSFYDLASIEVLRGPQGTLVGSNSTGGAVFINTQSPTLDRVKGYAQLGYGSFNAIDAQAAINLPVSDDLAVRMAGTGRWRDSYYTDIGSFANDPDSLDEQAGRLGIMWNPGAFRATAKVEWVDRNTGGYAYRPIAGTDFDDNLQPDIRTLTYNTPTENSERAFLASLELRYELDGGVTLRSVSGYSNKRIDNLYDSDGAIVPPDENNDNIPDASATQVLDQFVRERQWSQEFNIISPTDGAFNWIVGGYYQRNKIDVDIAITTGDIVDPTDIINLQDKTTWGVFAQTGYRFSEQFELQLGARYSHFKADGGGSVTIGAGSPIFGPDGLVVADLAGSHEDGRMTGKVALNWTPNDDNLVYVFAARGYKPGGSNSAVSEFGPETVWDYEAGWKSTLFDGQVNTQLGVFYMDYKNFQFDARDPSTGQAGVFNISDATIKGAELQLQGSFGNLRLDGGIAYVNSNLDEVVIVNQRTLPPLQAYGPQCAPGVPSNPPVCFDFGPFLVTAGGGPNLFSPEWSYNFGAEYSIDVGGDAVLIPRVNYAYVGPRWTNLLYDPATDRLEGRGLLSAMLTLDLPDWQLQAWATNLLDKEYVSGQSGNNEFYGAPREVGIRATMRF